jgi:hypothetical protein
MKQKFELTLCVLLSLLKISNAQITEEQARSVDSLLTNIYLASPTFHTMSVLVPNLYVWTAGSGFKDNKYVNWTHKGKVSSDDIVLANSQPNQYLAEFDLDNYNLPEDYKIAVENFLRDIGFPVSINDLFLESNIYPNPTFDKSNLIIPSLKPNEEYKILIFDMSGKNVKSYNGTTDNRGLNTNIDLTNLNNGVYLIRFQNDEVSFSKKVIKR